MALIQCTECGGQVSDKAPACPKCGCPVASMGAAPAPVSAPTPAPVAEALAWSGCPSQWRNLWIFLASILLIPIPWAIWRYLQTRNSQIEITTERIRIWHGVIARGMNEVELYRVRDSEYRCGMLQRFLGCGSVTIYTTDVSSGGVIVLDWLPGAQDAREALRRCVEQCRTRKGVRALDGSLAG